MLPQQLLALSKQYYQNLVKQELWDLFEQLAIEGEIDAFLDSESLYQYGTEDSPVSLVYALEKLGYQISHLGDTRLGGREYVRVSWSDQLQG